MIGRSYAETAEQGTSSDIQASQPLRIFFYNPEINASRNLVLKQTWDKYLLEQGQFSFQPVDQEENFKRLLKDEAQAAFIMAKWFYDALNDPPKAQLELALQGVKAGKATYRRVLVGPVEHLEIMQARIASSGSKQRALQIIAKMYPELSPSQRQQLKLLTVPKDIDALMALGYGLADLALSSEASLESLARLNETRFRQLRILKESQPLKQSVVVFKNINNEEKQRISRAFLDIATMHSGQQAMSLIGLDDWRPPATLSAKAGSKRDSSTQQMQNKNGGQE